MFLLVQSPNFAAPAGFKREGDLIIVAGLGTRNGVGVAKLAAVNDRRVFDDHILLWLRRIWRCIRVGLFVAIHVFVNLSIRGFSPAQRLREPLLWSDRSGSVPGSAGSRPSSTARLESAFKMSLIRSGSSTPGICSRIWPDDSAPCRCSVGSLTPKALMRLSMIFIACSTD